MEYIKKKDVLQNLNLTDTKFRFYRESGYFKDACIIGNSYCISREDYIKLEGDLKWIKDSYTLQEVSKLLGYKSASKNVICSKFSEEDCKRIFNKYYIKKDSVDTYVRKILNPFNEIVSEGYLTLLDVCKRLNIKKSYISDGIKIGEITDYIKHPLTDIIYLSPKAVNYIEEEISLKTNGITIKELLSIFNKEFKKDYYTVNEEIQRYSIRGNTYYDKNAIDNILKENEYKEDAFTKIFGRTLLLESNSTNEDGLVKHKNKDYVSIKKLNSIYPKISSDSWKTGINKKTITNALFSNNQWYIEYNLATNIAKIYLNSYSIIDFVRCNELYRYERYLTSKNVRDRFFPNAFLFNYFGAKHYRFTVQDIKLFKKDLVEQIDINNQIKSTTDPYRLYDLLLCSIDSNFIFTLKKFKEYVYHTLNNSKSNNKRLLVFQMVGSLKTFLELLDSDVNSLLNEDVEEIYSCEEISSTNRLHIGNFLNFYKSNNSKDCGYTIHFNRYIAALDRKEDDIYSFEEWIRYLNYLTDIDTHIVKASQNIEYSRLWLYSLMHFTTAWRKGDIINLPSLEHLDIDVYSLDWFKDNVFTITDGQKIINDIKFKIDLSRVNKTTARNNFSVPPVLCIPLAIAFIFTEKHRRLKSLPSLFLSKNIYKKHFAKYFGDVMVNFSSLKANRSMLTHEFNFAGSIEGTKLLAYTMSSHLRAHISNNNDIAPATLQYIYDTNDDGSARKIATALFERGIGGWIIKTLIDACYNTDNPSISEITDVISKIDKEFSLAALEDMSKFLQFEAQSKLEVLNEIYSLPKEKIKLKLNKLLKGQLVSKKRNIHCLKENCAFPLQDNCLFCKYHIPTIYTVNTIKEELDSYIKKINSIDDDNIYERARYTHFIVKLLSLLNELKLSFSTYDKDFISAFIDLKSLEEEINHLKKSKFLVLK